MNKENTIKAAQETLTRVNTTLCALVNQDILDTKTTRFKLNMCAQTLVFLLGRPYDEPIGRKIWLEINLVDSILGVA